LDLIPRAVERRIELRGKSDSIAGPNGPGSPLGNVGGGRPESTEILRLVTVAQGASTLSKKKNPQMTQIHTDKNLRPSVSSVDPMT
jgi:hypothetical protein